MQNYTIFYLTLNPKGSLSDFFFPLSLWNLGYVHMYCTPPIWRSQRLYIASGSRTGQHRSRIGLKHLQVDTESGGSGVQPGLRTRANPAASVPSQCPDPAHSPGPSPLSAPSGKHRLFLPFIWHFSVIHHVWHEHSPSGELPFPPLSSRWEEGPCIFLCSLERLVRSSVAAFCMV